MTSNSLCDPERRPRTGETRYCGAVQTDRGPADDDKQPQVQHPTLAWRGQSADGEKGEANIKAHNRPYRH